MTNNSPGATDKDLHELHTTTCAAATMALEIFGVLNGGSLPETSLEEDEHDEIAALLEGVEVVVGVEKEPTDDIVASTNSSTAEEESDEIGLNRMSIWVLLELYLSVANMLKPSQSLQMSMLKIYYGTF